jgi:serine protease AprX
MAHGLAVLWRTPWGVRLSARLRSGLLVAASATLLALLAAASQLAPAVLDPSSGPATSQATSGGSVSPTIAKLASDHPRRQVDVIVQLRSNATSASVRSAAQALGARVTGDLHVFRGFGAAMTAHAARELARHSGVRAVSLDAPVKQKALDVDARALETSFNQSIGSVEAWRRGATGEGVGVAVIDTGIAGDLPDFQVSETDSSSRVVASAVTNHKARTAGDSYGHGSHVAGIIAGNGANRTASDPLDSRYVGVAPDASLVSVKIADEDGNASVLDVIYGLEFVIDHKDDYGIRVVNLSLESTEPESYRTDPLDAAAEAAWFSGIVVVAAGGNRGSDSDAVSYAPGNDPYVISVGALDDNGTDDADDDEMASWSSRGTTQDGFEKPELLAPGSRIASVLAPGSEFASLCPSCIVGDAYIKAGGTSMSAPMVAGAVADLLEVHPDWTPDQVKGVLLATAREVPGGAEVSLPAALAHDGSASANEGLTPNVLIDDAEVDGGPDAEDAEDEGDGGPEPPSLWKTAPVPLQASWAPEASWVCRCAGAPDVSVGAERSRWSRSRWTRSRWTRSRWTRSRWTRSRWTRSRWTRSRWTRSRWTRSRWTRSRWTTHWLTSFAK